MKQEEITIIDGADAPKKSLKKRTSPFNFLRSIQKRMSDSQYSYLLLAFLIPTVIMYVVYLAMEIHPFGDGSVLVLDLNGQYVYFFEALRNFVRGDASLLYSFSRALGGEFMGMYAYYLASPISYIVALFPTERMLEALLVIILLKTGLCGASFGYYLHKNSRVPNRFAVLAFSTMYALCAYAVIYQNNIMWIDALICLPLITYAIEQLIKFRKYKLFVISLALGIISNFYIGYMLCIWVAIYYFYYFFSHNDGRNNPIQEKSHFLRSFIRIAFFSALAVAISALLIFTAYYSLQFGKNDFSSPNWSLTENFDILDYLTKFLPGSYDTVRPEGLPNVYAGMLMIILIPVYFVSQKISAREKIASLLIIIFFSLCFICNPLDLIWHGFQRPNWLNYRYSFILVFFMLTLAYKGFGNLRHVGEKFILGIGAIITIFIVVAQKQEFETYIKSDNKLLSLETVWLGILATVAFVALLCLLIKLKNVFKRESVCCVLVALVCVEVFCSSLACVNQHDKDVIYSGYSGYNSYLEEMRPIVEDIKEYDNTFFRFEKTNQRKLNDNFALGIRGLSNSTSTLNASTIKFLNQMGYASKSHWSKYLGGTPVSDSLLGIKYIISDTTSENSKFLDKYYYSVLEEDDTNIAYLNPYALSIAYGIDPSTMEFNMDKYTSHFDRLNSLVGTMLGNNEPEELFVPLHIENTTLTNINESSTADHKRYYIMDENKKGYLIFETTAQTNDEIFMYLPTEYQHEAAVSVNGVSKGTVHGNETDRIISIGAYTPGEKITIKIMIDNEYNDLYVKEKTNNYFYYLDQQAFTTAFEKLSSNPQFITNEKSTDDNIQGTITTQKEDQYILTTIPYDKGWHVYVDGEEISYSEALGAVIAFEIPEAGEHSLQFKYRSSAVTYGLIISIGGTIAFLLICIIEFILRKMRCRFAFTVQGEEIYWELEDFDADDEEYRTTARPNGFLNTTSKISFKELRKKNIHTAPNDSQKEDQNANDTTDSE